MVAHFMQHKFGKPPTVPQQVEDRIISLAQIIAYLRAGGKETDYRQRPEIGTRIAKQLIKLGRCLAVVRGKRSPSTPTVIRSWSVSPSTPQRDGRGEIVTTLFKHYPKHRLITDIASEAAISNSTVFRKLEDLFELGVVTRERQRTTSRRSRQSTVDVFALETVS